VISPTLTVLEAKFTRVNTRLLCTRTSIRFLAVNRERSLLAKHLATQLLLRLNPKRGAAAAIECPQNSCGLALKVLLDSEEPHSREKQYGFACPSHKSELDLDLRYT